MAEPVITKNVAEMYERSARLFGNRPAFATRKKGTENWDTVNFKELYETGLALATALIELGVKARDHVALLADNRLEWIVADYGIQLCGACDVPRGTDVTDQDIQYIIPHSEAKVVFVEHAEMLKKLMKNKRKLGRIKHIILMDKATKPPRGVLSMYDLLEKGDKLRARGNRKAEERIKGIKPDDLFTLIYTSGTTGAPKGVMLTHANICSQFREEIVPLSSEDRILSILPVWHIFERGFEMLAISRGCCTYYTNVRTLGEDIKLVKPTFMGSAPRLWENIYLKIMDGVKSKGAVPRALFKAAYFCSRMFQGSLFFITGKSLDLEGRNPLVSLAMGLFHVVRAILFLVPYFLLDAIVLKKLRGATGGQLKGSVSGGGALPLHVDEFFNYIGIPVLEGYGMTETAPTLAVRSFKRLVIGTVGPVFPNTQIRIVDLNNGSTLYPDKNRPANGRGLKGEIHAKGPQVMRGYFKNPEATKRVLHDGWMNTGDIGMITFNDCVKIMGRSKDTVVLIGGENVEPVPIENKLVESVYIDQCMVVGQDQKYLSVLIVPSLDGFAKKGIKAKTHKDLAALPEAKKLVSGEIKLIISSDNGFKSFEKVQDFRFITKPFEVGDEMTNLFKLKRHVITEKYKKEIASMYD
ncbi:MAG: AMP-binding protein [Leptospirales bacterium]|nr:AMP-binding protein [Leptospirales bacterium]